TRGAELGGFLDDPIHALAARDALRECQGKRRFTIEFPVLLHADNDTLLADLLDACTELSTGAVENRERVAASEPQYPRNVIRRSARNDQRLAGDHRRLHVDPSQSHVACSIPSRATSTIKSISSGVMT